MRVTNYIYAKPELRKYVIEQGFTLTKVSEMTGITRQTLQKILMGTSCAAPTAKKICDAFGIELWTYFEIVECKKD